MYPGVKAQHEIQYLVAQNSSKESNLEVLGGSDEKQISERFQEIVISRKMPSSFSFLQDAFVLLQSFLEH
jgi:hypothetical protein